MSEWLADKWINLTSRDIWRLWPEGIIDSLNSEPSILDDTPLLGFLESTLAEFNFECKRHAIVGTVDSNVPEYVTYRLEDAQVDQLPQTIASSASLAFLFIPQQLNGRVNIDGGTWRGLDASSAVEKCLELVSDESQITLDIILLDQIFAPDSETYADTTNAINNLMRARSVQSYYTALENVIEVMVTYPNVNYRYMMEPSDSDIFILEYLDFSYRNTWPMQENGRADSQTCLDYGPGFGFDDL